MSIKWLRAIHELQERIEELTPRWVRVEDGLPENEENYCIMIGNCRTPYMLRGRYVRNRWINANGCSFLDDAIVIAWLKVPPIPHFILQTVIEVKP